MKKPISCLLILISTSVLLGAQELELPYRAVETSPYYDNGYHHIGDIQYDEVVYAINSGSYYSLTGANAFSTFEIRIMQDDGSYLTYAKNLAPLNTASLFGVDIIVNYGQLVENGVKKNLPNEMWVPVYYCEVLVSRDRETLTTFEPHLLEYNTGDTFEYGIPMRWYLHTYTHISSGMYMFYNSMIYAGIHNTFLVKNIFKVEYGYKVTCLGPYEIYPKAGPNFDWSLYSGGEIDLLLYVDGEYIDMYFNDKTHKFGTVVRVQEEFIRQYEALMETNTCDLTNVVWPRRADGSMDYPPPQSTQAAVTEQPETIDIPPAGYEEAAGFDPVEETVEQQPETRFPWVIIVIIAGIVLAGGATAFVVLRKKK
jgi:hypothetical protein